MSKINVNLVETSEDILREYLLSMYDKEIVDEMDFPKVVYMTQFMVYSNWYASKKVLDVLSSGSILHVIKLN